MSRPKLIAIGAVGTIGLLVIGYFLWPSESLLLELEPVATTTPEIVASVPFVTQVIGASVEARPITVYQFGEGPIPLLFVGGIHGGYEWNSVLLANEAIAYLTANPAEVPGHLTIHIIPNLNPDGLVTTLGTTDLRSVADVPNPTVRDAAGRFNANGVDLNRNFDCKWAPESSWRGQTVSAGTGPFSEPEAAALRDYVLAINPAAVAFWHSQANNVYASECEAGVLPDTLALMNAYATAGSYGAVASFDAYPITGDAEGWLASIGIPAVTVELESFSSTEWTRNWAGMQAWFLYFEEPLVNL